MNKLSSAITIVAITAGCGKVSHAINDNTVPYNTDAGDSTADFDAGTDSNADTGHDSGADALSDATADSTSDAVTDAPADAISEDSGIIEVQYLTRGQLARELKADVMLYPDFDEQCTPTATDIAPDTELCRAVKFMTARAIMGNYLNIDGTDTGIFAPDDLVGNDQLWKTTAVGLQWTPFIPASPKWPDLPNNDWAAPFAYALDDKGIQIASPDGSAHPHENTTLEKWADLKDEFQTHFEQPLTRAEIAELAGHSLLNLGPSTSQNLACSSTTFLDIQNDTLTCYYVGGLGKLGLIDTSQINYRPNDHVLNADLAKLYTLARGWPISCTGCSGNDCADWYSAYVDALCGKGWVNSNFDPGASTSIIAGSQLAWDISFSGQ